MAQVDRDLTTVDYFDRLLGLIKNLGHHTSRSAARPTQPSACDVARGRELERFNFKWPCSNANFSKFSN
jgi:hypothetical protein